MIIHDIDEQHIHDDPKSVPLLYRELPTPPGWRVCHAHQTQQAALLGVTHLPGLTWFNHEQWWYHEPISNGDI